MYKQLVKPKLNTRAQMGMCLEYVQNAYGSGWAGTYALEGWNKINKFNHPDDDIPTGVYAPIWFSGMWNGFNYGHVAIYKDGMVYSSPYTNKTTHDTLGSIAEVERIYGMSFIGWSEDIGETRVIIPAEEIDMERVDELFKKLNSTNKRLDAANKKLAEAEADKQKLWSALHRTNKNGDLLRVAIASLSESTGSKIDLDEYEIQLVKRK